MTGLTGESLQTPFIFPEFRVRTVSEISAAGIRVLQPERLSVELRCVG